VLKSLSLELAHDLKAPHFLQDSKLFSKSRKERKMETMMNIVILGAGGIGSYLALHLAQDGYNVVVIDHAAKPLERLSESADVATRLGNGTNWRLLQELLDFKPDLFVAVSSDDETNLVACSIAKNLGYPKTIARIRSESYLDKTSLDFERLFFIDYSIGTELIVANDIVKYLVHDLSACENFVHGSIQTHSLVIPSSWEHAHKKIADLKLPENLLIGLIHRKKQQDNHVIFPTGQDMLLPGDEITLIGDAKAMLKIPQFFSTPKEIVDSVLILGGGQIAIHLGRLLESQGTSFKIIDEDENVCKKVAEALPKATVLCHEPTDINFLVEERIQTSEGVVALTASHETNVLLAALCKQLGCPKVIPLVSEERYLPFLRHLGLHMTVSERMSILSRVRSILKTRPLFSISSLYGDRAKILEVKVSAGSQIVGIPIADLRAHLPKDFLFALIENRGKVAIPKGTNILTPGDSVMVICHPKHLTELEKIF
jgi:trk system potassium uptake protein TrkA